MSNNANSNNKIKLEILERETALRRAQELVHSNPATKYCVLDTSGDGKTLLVFCATSFQTKPVKQILNDVWKGEIETICASDYAGGG